ncbi:baseplate J/gp47 family protein [Leptospira interrogans]|uniref:Baseplate J-like protein n=2 Tax=Leptospira interrogans TaxID=173 RepID=A0A0E2D3S6_LEPIR|nr:baseplate J/gp47 family protein [Leptospira interrogans]EKR54523.1 baseplate J-like protein [Leptospira interrogans str. UI 12758]EMP09509.1 baseplate J-like protein [Leptospira interrogans serovar Pyrogenes str. 200701872]KGE25138.1 baseplate protein J [Leptospira interrogans serovar Lai]
MTSYGATLSGFVIKDEEAIKSDLVTLAQNIFGPNEDISPYAPLGKFIELISESQFLIWQAIESDYNESYLDTASGIALDRLVRLRGVKRKEAQSEMVILVIHGLDYATVPKGLLVSTPKGVQFKSSEDKTILSGSASVQFEAVIPGLAQRVIPNSLTVFVNPNTDYYNVTNPQSSSGGSERETDPELLARYLGLVTTEKDSGALPYTKAQVENEPSIVSCSIRENKLGVQVDDLPANSLHFIVDGGTDDLVANLIYKYKPGGIRLSGSVQKTIDGNLIYFDRPSDLQIFIKVEIWRNSLFDNNSITFIKTAIVRTIGGVDTIAGVNYPYKGLGTGKNVVAYPIYSAIGNVVGVDNLLIQLGTSSGTTNANMVVVSPTQVAKAFTANIQVVIH